MRMLAAGTKVAPTLPASRGSLPPEGTLRLWLGKAGSTAPAGKYVALATACSAMPPVGAIAPAVWQSQFHGPCWGGRNVLMLTASRHMLSGRIRQAGFTLIELLIVVAIMAIATAGVGLALRDSSGTALEREAQRLAVLLDSARVQSRMTANPVRWRPTPSGFAFEGLSSESSFPATWLGQDVRVASNAAVVLGPEPVIGPQQIRLVSISQPTRSLTLATDGIRPFAVVIDGAP